MKTALITGITGQDGAYLAELLLQKGYMVHGIKRRSSLFNTKRVDHLYRDKHEKNVRFQMHFGDLTDSTNIIRIIQEVKPDEIYNLGAMSHVRVSFEMPEYTANADALGALRILEAVRILGMSSKTRIYQASSSELYGESKQIPQNENTPFHPRSPYGIAKLYAYWIMVNYRESFGIYAANGILFNHESPFRGETFVTRKITRAVARIVHGLQDCVYLGNLDAVRDWGHARDFVVAMWKILQQNTPEDFVIATGIGTSVREFLIKAFLHVGVELEFQGHGEQELAIVKDAIHPDYFLEKGKVVMRIDKTYYRPSEVDVLIGDSTKARTKLDWQPTYGLDDIIREMVDADLKIFSKDKFLLDSGHEVDNYDED